MAAPMRSSRVESLASAARTTVPPASVMLRIVVVARVEHDHFVAGRNDGQNSGQIRVAPAVIVISYLGNTGVR